MTPHALRILAVTCATFLHIASSERTNDGFRLELDDVEDASPKHGTTGSGNKALLGDTQRRIRAGQPKTARCESEVSALWLNTLLASLWPKINTAVKKETKYFFEQSLPQRISRGCGGEGRNLSWIQWAAECFTQTIKLDEDFRLGAGSPVMRSVSVCQDPDEKGVVMQADLSYNSGSTSASSEDDMNIQINIGLAWVGIRHISFRGIVLIHLDELLEEWPLVGGVSLSFLEPPDLEIKLTGVTSIPKLDSIIVSTLIGHISDKMVLPKRITIPIANEIQNRGFRLATLKNPTPEGILRVVPKQASEVPYTSGLGFKGRSYMHVELGDAKWQSSTKSATSPKWDADQGDFLCLSRQQHLKLSLWDYQRLTLDEEYLRLNQPIQKFLTQSVDDLFKYSWKKEGYTEDSNLEVGFQYFVAETSPGPPFAQHQSAPPLILVVDVASAMGQGKLKFVAEILDEDGQTVREASTPESTGIQELHTLDKTMVGVYKKLASSSLSHQDQVFISGLSEDAFSLQDNLSQDNEGRSAYNQLADFVSILYLPLPANLWATGKVKLSVVSRKGGIKSEELFIRDVSFVDADAKNNPVLPEKCEWRSATDACIVLSLLKTQPVSWSDPDATAQEDGSVSSRAKASLANPAMHDIKPLERAQCTPRESTAWLNQLLGQRGLGPNIEAIVQKHLVEQVTSVMQEEFKKTGTFLNSVISVGAKGSFGKSSMTFGAVKLCRGSSSRGTSLKIHLPFTLDSDQVDLRVTAKGVGDIGGLKNLKVKGNMTIALEQVIDRTPLVAGVVIGFVQHPLIDFDLTSIAGYSGIEDKVRKNVNKKVDGMLVIPNRVVVPLARKAPDVDFALMKNPPPHGVLVVSRPSVRGLQVDEWARTVTGDFNPYFSASLGKSRWDTDAKSETKNAAWEAGGGLLFWDYEEEVTFEIKDAAHTVAKAKVHTVQELLDLSRKSQSQTDLHRPLDGTWVPKIGKGVSFAISGDSMLLEDGTEIFLRNVSDTKASREDDLWKGNYSFDGHTLIDSAGVSWQKRTCDNTCGSRHTTIQLDHGTKMTFSLDEVRGRKIDHVSAESCVSGCKALPWAEKGLWKNAWSSNRKCKKEVRGGQKVSISPNPDKKNEVLKLCCQVLPCQPNRPGEIAMRLDQQDESEKTRKGKLRLAASERRFVAPNADFENIACLVVLKLHNVYLQQDLQGMPVKVVASIDGITRETSYATGVRSSIQVEDMYRGLIERMERKGLGVDVIAHLTGLDMHVIQEFKDDRDSDFVRASQGMVDLDSALYFLLPALSGTIKLDALIGNKKLSGEIRVEEAALAIPKANGGLTFPDTKIALPLDLDSTGTLPDSAILIHSLSYASVSGWQGSLLSEWRGDPDINFVG